MFLPQKCPNIPFFWRIEPILSQSYWGQKQRDVGHLGIPLQNLCPTDSTYLQPLIF